MIIKIFHMNIEKERPGITPDGKLLSNGYEHVANLDTEVDMKIAEALEEAWFRTNSIDDAWYESNLVEIVNGADGLRSSMIGDRFEINGDLYEVESLGFSKVDLQPNRP